jgi:hypothetical protein
MEKPMNRRTLIKILFFGAGAVIGSKILHLPGFDNLAAASQTGRRADPPVTDPCHLMFTIEDPIKGTTRIKMGIAREGKTVIRDLDLDSVCVRSVDQKNEITYSSFEKWLMAKAKVPQESRFFYQLYNVNTKEGFTRTCDITDGLVENIAPTDNLMDPDGLTQRVGNALILCEQFYLGFKTVIDKTIVEPMNGPTRLETKNTIRHNIAALRGLSV